MGSFTAERLMPAHLPLFVIPEPSPQLNDAHAIEDAMEYDCYCGLGPACPVFRQMNPAQRAACTRDKRQTAQWFYMNGMTE